jgi:hypothetical protein
MIVIMEEILNKNAFLYIFLTLLYGNLEKLCKFALVI